jgi:UDP-2,3-diacylglucosamine pyrophosphatase LpxH
MRRWIVAVLLLLSACCHMKAATPFPPAPVLDQPAGPRTRVFISDLHFGPGKNAQGVWDPYEDFRWAPEFDAFLQAIDKAGGGATDLVVVGDAFEVWQPRTDDCECRCRDLSCTADGAVALMEKILSQHKAEMASLRRFADSGTNRVVFLPGNHDGVLLYPKVGDALVASIGAQSGRVAVARAGHWLSPDGMILAEHGHQIDLDGNAYEDWPSPFFELAPGGEKRLRRSWGEQFMYAFYNNMENRYPIIDNIDGTMDAVKLAVAREGAAGLAKAVGRFLNFLFFQMTYDQTIGILGAQAENAWDVKAVRAEKRRFLIEALKADPDSAALYAVLQNDHEADAAAARLSDEQIVALCDQLKVLHRANAQIQLCPIRTVGLGSPATEGPDTTNPHLGALVNQNRGAMAVLYKYLSRRRDDLLAQDSTRKPFQLFVWAHTHKETPSQKIHIGPWELSHVNTGAWQRVASASYVVEKAGGDRKAALAKVKIEELPPSYSYVMVKPYGSGEVPIAELLCWTTDGAQWQTAACARYAARP